MPTLIINPHSDHEFTRLVRQKLSAARTPDELQTLLRTQYERSLVRKRELSGETDAVWYVYRDGSWTSAHEQIAEGTLMAEERDDLRATAESIVEDAERLKRIESRKLDLVSSENDEVKQLAVDADELAEDISDKAKVEMQLADEIADSP